MSRHRPRPTRWLAAAAVAPLTALLGFAAAPEASAAGRAAAPALPTICHKLSTKTDQYTLGCREGVRQGRAAGRADGSPPFCARRLPPLAPVKPTVFEQGKIAGWKFGYDEAFPPAFKQNCAGKQTEPKPPPPPPPNSQQTPESMFALGKQSGENWGKEDAKSCTRTHAELTAGTDALVIAFQNGYRVGYDTAYDEAYRQNCLKKTTP
ncbi:hypothetical protein AB0953_08335 [Streptomyces sp. NPDC046866]|uniref:hypothetical protein n=1 Tax=Streptomyces sp. NPDC046866 TaxID=3154921 RepID=UPI0034563692